MDHNRCCDDRCCPTVVLDSVLQVDIRVAMVISLTVIAACVVVGVACVVCCFVSSCPLYDACSGTWEKGQQAVQDPAYFFNGYAAPPGSGEDLPAPRPNGVANGGARVKGRRAAGKSGNNGQSVVAAHPVKISNAEEV